MKGKILIVDDEPTIVSVFKRYFEALGYEVRGSRNAEEAIALADKESFDFIFLDHLLPGMSGLRALPKLSRRRKTPVFLITGHYDDELKKDARHMGAAGVFEKPLDFEALAKRLAKPVP